LGKKLKIDLNIKGILDFRIIIKEKNEKAKVPHIVVDPDVAIFFSSQP